MKVYIKKEDALKLLQEHKTRHIKEHAEAVEDWKIAVQKQQEKYTEWIKGDRKNKEPDRLTPQQPENYTEDYDKWIMKFTFDTRDIIELDSNDQNVVLHDEFGWKGQFAMYNSSMKLAANS